MTKTCIIIGEPERAASIKKLLEDGGVTARALAHNVGQSKLVETCAGDSTLRVVAVCCRDFPIDYGVGLFRALGSRLSAKNIGLYALLEASDPTTAMRQLGAVGIHNTYHKFPMSSAGAATAIRDSWYRGVPHPGKAQSPSAKKGNGNGNAAHPFSGGVCDVANSWVLGIGLPVVAVEEPQGEPPKQEKEVPPKKSQEKAKEVLPKKPVEKEKPPERPHEEFKVDSALSKMLQLLQHNPPLPREMVIVDIVGMHGEAVNLDPRRIRPLLGQPRNKESQGFSQKSIAELGESMRSGGQLEEVSVCPIVGNQDFDAQLIDGERRLKGSLAAGIMIRATVREDVTPEMVLELYLLSVMRNTEKEPHTTLEFIEMVRRFRGPEYGFSLLEVGKILSMNKNTVNRYEMLGRLDQDVLVMLDDGSSKEAGGVVKRKLTSQLALLLIDISAGKQQEVAKDIVAKGMNYNQARRYVLNVRRGLGLKGTVAGRGRQSRQFDALGTLTRRNLNAYGVYLDMPTAELVTLFANRTDGERSGLCQDLRKLAADASELVERIESA